MARPTKTYIYILLIVACICIGLALARMYRKTVEPFTQYSLPRIIWTYWHDPRIPPKIEKIMREREAVLSTWEHRLLNEETVYDYIPRDAFPEGYSKLGHQHKADWIRLYLLKTYAGCWMDASIIVNRTDEIEEIYEESVSIQSELSAYSDSGTSNYIETFLLMAPAESKVIELWFTEYTSAIESGFLPYKKKVTSKIDVSNCFAGDDDVYLTTSAALQYTLRVHLYTKPRMVLKDRYKTMYKYLAECKHDSKCVIAKIKNTPKDEQPPNIKLTRFNREYL
jgi:hypothetical protein